jgi:hypothetical protein
MKSVWVFAAERLLQDRSVSNIKNYEIACSELSIKEYEKVMSYGLIRKDFDYLELSEEFINNLIRWRRFPTTLLRCGLGFTENNDTFIAV